MPTDKKFCCNLISDWPALACLARDLQIFLVVLKSLLELAERIKRVSNVAVGPALARFVACENRKFNGLVMLRSHWPALACLVLYLQTFLLVLDCLLEIAKLFVADTNVAVRRALAVLITCKIDFNG